MELDLTGTNWWVREALGDTWQWYVSQRLPQAANNVASAGEAIAAAPGWLPARVPSSVVADLVRAGVVDDPERGLNSKAAEWVSTRHWVYRCSFRLAPVSAGETAVLCLAGVDPAATVVVDGHRVGEVTGLFHRHTLDLTPHLGPGEQHELALVVHPAPASEPQVGHTPKVAIHAPRMTYGWDFCPRLVHQGIWQGVSIRVAPWHLTHVTARPSLTPDGAGEVALGVQVTGTPPELIAELVELGVSARAREAAGGCSADDATVTLEGRVVARARLDVSSPCAPGVPAALDTRSTSGMPEGPDTSTASSTPALHVAYLRVDAPHHWSPSKPYRYELRVRTSDGELVHRATTGFRDLRFHRPPGAPEQAPPLAAIIDGHPQRLVGVNWVPARAQFGEITRADLAHLLTLAKRAGSTMVRVWGGGLIETEGFYDLADELGLLVWQEFSLSSSGMDSTPSRDPAFVALMRREAEALVPRLTHHPCLAMWCGGNELDVDGDPARLDNSPVLVELRDVVRRLDPGRHWAPSSPWGPQANNRLDIIAADPDGMHDVHGPWEHQGLIDHYRLANAGVCLAHTEFGVEGMANRRTLAHLIPAEHRLPVDRSNPYHRHAGEWWDNAELVNASFGGRLESVPEAGRLEAYRRASQLLQASGLAYAVGADLRRWPRCAMVLIWQLNEPFPNAWCTAVIDRRGDAKPAYHALARAFAPRRVTVRVERAAWAGCETLSAQAWVWDHASVADDPMSSADAGGSVTLELIDLSGRQLASVSAAFDRAGDPAPVVDLVTAHPGGSGMVAWRATWTDAAGRLIDREVTLATLGADFGPLLDLPATALQVEVSTTAAPVARDGDSWTIAVCNTGSVAAIGVELLDARPYEAPGWVVLDGDPRPLLPGERRELRARWCDDHDRDHDGDRNDGDRDDDRHGSPAREPRALALEAWNCEPITLYPPNLHPDVPPSSPPGAPT